VTVNGASVERSDAALSLDAALMVAAAFSSRAALICCPVITSRPCAPSSPST
jgi:hypothetical protein